MVGEQAPLQMLSRRKQSSDHEVRNVRWFTKFTRVGTNKEYVVVLELVEGFEEYMERF